jgi:predicted transcriptional regulator
MSNCLPEIHQETKCLKVKHNFAEMIVNGEKIWEIRLRRTKIRGRIAIGDTNTKKVIGYVTIFNCIKFSNVQGLEVFEKHHKASKFINDYVKGKTEVFAYCLENPEREPNPYAYTYSTGSWCKAIPPRGDEWK